jgi:hypothetical protein
MRRSLLPGPGAGGRGPALGLPDTRVGTFTQALYDEAMNGGWVVISIQYEE